MSRRPMMVGNWKMNKSASEATQLVQQLVNGYDRSFKAVDVVVCPPFTALRSVQVSLEFDNKSSIALGAQDVYWEPAGAYTGAISAGMLKDLNCSYCLVGHSERREYFLESDEQIALKVKALVEADITPIICCGESLEQHQQGSTNQFVVAQIEAALSHLQAADGNDIVLAYEPIWAIGSGHTPLPEEADAVCLVLRDTCSRLYGSQAAETIRILYGGSMNLGNVESFCTLPNIDGGLVGGASLKADDFLTLVKAVS